MPSFLSLWRKKIKPIRTIVVCFYFHKGDWPSGNGISPSTSHGKFCWGCCCLVMYLFLPDIMKISIDRRIFVYILCLINICHFFSDRSMKTLWISKEHNNFSYVWNSEADIPNSFAFATQQFFSFWWQLFYNDSNNNDNYYYYYYYLLFVIACKALHKFLK